MALYHFFLPFLPFLPFFFFLEKGPICFRTRRPRHQDCTYNHKFRKLSKCHHKSGRYSITNTHVLQWESKNSREWTTWVLLLPVRPCDAPFLSRLGPQQPPARTLRTKTHQCNAMWITRNASNGWDVLSERESHQLGEVLQAFKILRFRCDEKIEFFLFGVDVHLILVHPVIH